MDNIRDKLQGGLLLCCMVSLCAYITTTMIITGSLVSYHYLADSFELYETSEAINYLNTAIKKPPIVDIKRTPTGVSCPKDYERVLISTWPGSKHGCECNGEIRTTGCNESCHPVSKIDAIKMFAWEEEDFCVKRNSAVKYIQVCPDTMRLCDDRYTCVPKEEDCPINTMEISYDFGFASTNGLKSIHLRKGKMLSFGHREQGTLLAPLHSIQGFTVENPCIVPLRTAETNTKAYGLLNLTIGCGKYGEDTRFSTYLDKQTERSFYENNAIYEKLTAELPNYSQFIESETSYLTARSTVRITNPACANLDWATFYRANFDLGIKTTSMKNLNSVSFVTMAIIVGLIARVVVARVFQRRALGNIPWIMIYVALFNVLMTFVYGLIATMFSVNYSLKVEQMNQFQDLRCFGSNSVWDAIIQDFTDPKNMAMYDKVFIWPRNLMIFSICLIAIMVCCYTALKKMNINAIHYIAGLAAGAIRNPEGYDPQIDVPVETRLESRNEPPASPEDETLNNSP